MKHLRITVAAFVVFAFVISCGGEATEPPPCEPKSGDADGEPFESLDEYCFFQGPLVDQDPVDGVVAYDVTAQLYSDRSRKNRFIALPDGEKIGFDATEHWDWPDETVIIKTFYYPVDATDPDAGEQILETRLLTKRDGVWKPSTYIWDDDQQRARLNNFGKRVDISFADEDGEDVEINYRIPNRNQCTDCHGQDGDIVPLGPRTRQLLNPFEGDEDRPVQLVDFTDRQLFDTPPTDIDDLFGVADPHDDTAPLEDRARAYLDANCAHCHNPDGRAGSSNLFLNVDETRERYLGICKTPVAAGSGAGGHSYDIVPGHPEDSILIYRMETLNPDHKMPELPITTVDEFGVDLVSQWIEEMEPAGCD